MDEYAGPLLAALRKLKSALGVVAALEADTLELRNALHARQLCERLALAADSLARGAEVETDARLRALFAACKVPLQRRLFPEGVAPEVAPRRQAQVSAVGRILRALAEVRKAPSPVQAAALALATAALALSERSVASAMAQASLVDAITAEQLRQHSLRQSANAALSALVSLDSDKGSALVRAFNTRAARAAPSGLPVAPPRVDRAQGAAAKRAPARVRGRAAR